MAGYIIDSATSMKHEADRAMIRKSMSLSKLVSVKLLLTLICILFLATRLYKITSVPASVYWDEASIGYNAYSIAQTLKDEWGEFLPVHFRAFGEFKLPVYIYSVVPFVKLFGLNAFSVRLPAVLFSLGVVIVTFFLAKKISGSQSVGVFSSFFVSVSPWFFIFSRTGYEATAGLFFYLLAIYFFLQYQKNSWHILLSVVGFVLSAYSYNSFRVIAPLTMLALVINWIPTFVGMTKEGKGMADLKWDLRKSVLPLMLSAVILVLGIIPIFRLYKYDTGGARLQAVRATSTTFIKNYFSHFSPDFLIFKGDGNLRSQQPGFGQLYLPELILVITGLMYIICRKPKVISLLPLFLLLLGPVPASITKESPHALRSVSMVPFFAMISAAGVSGLLGLFKKKLLVYLVVVVIFLSFFLNYYLNFLNTYPIKSSAEWQYGYKKIYTDFNSQFGKYDHIYISDKYAQPYIFTLFYLKYDPDKFRREVVRNSVGQWGFSTVWKFGKFEFGKFPEMVSFN